MSGETRPKKVLVVNCLLYDDKNDKVLMVCNRDTESWSLPGGRHYICVDRILSS